MYIYISYDLQRKKLSVTKFKRVRTHLFAFG